MKRLVQAKVVFDATDDEKRDPNNVSQYTKFQIEVKGEIIGWVYIRREAPWIPKSIGLVKETLQISQTVW